MVLGFGRRTARFRRRNSGGRMGQGGRSQAVGRESRRRRGAAGDAGCELEGFGSCDWRGLREGWSCRWCDGFPALWWFEGAEEVFNGGFKKEKKYFILQNENQKLREKRKIEANL